MYNYNDLSSYEVHFITENTKRLLSYNEVENFIKYSLKFYIPSNIGNIICNSSLLLGIGFSIACNQNFDLSNLTQQMINSNPIISSIFRHLQKGNLDIEETMRIVNDSKKVLEYFYQQNQNTYFDNAIKQLQIFIENLKTQFITTIQTNHIPNIDDGAKMSARNFITIYNCIFTLNYDLLLYWVTSLNWATFSDGFGRADDGLLIFNHNFGAKPFYFLHGALHLFYSSGDIIKLETSIPYYSNILDEINIQLTNNQYPVCVTAGTTDEKREMIKGNYYLSRCFDALCFLCDYNLIIFGTRLKDNDEHIRKAILQSGVKNIFFSVSNNSWMQAKQDLNAFIQNANTKGKNVFFYNYDDPKFDVWGNKNNTSNHNNAIGI